MKTISIKYLILSAIMLLVILGSSDITSEQILSTLGLKDKAPSDFATIQAMMRIPEVNLEDVGCRGGTPNILIPTKDTFYLQDFEKKFFPFLINREYDSKLNWCVDKRVRDTGPFIKDVYYGIHPPVRIYYSPRMMYWLTGDISYWPEGEKVVNPHSAKRKKCYSKQPPRFGPVPNGAMIVKEMFSEKTSAGFYKNLKQMIEENPACADEYEKVVASLIKSWVGMIKTDGVSADGWFYGSSNNINPKKSSQNTIEKVVKRQLDTLNHIPWAGYASPCIRCHASAANDEMTFSDLTNVKGFNTDENLLSYRDDYSWRNGNLLHQYPFDTLLKIPCVDTNLFKTFFELQGELLPEIPKECTYSTDYFHAGIPYDPAGKNLGVSPLGSVNPDFVKTFYKEGIQTASPKTFPSQWADNVFATPDLDLYISSESCQGCHGGLGGSPYDVAMFIKTGPEYGDGFNVSEYGEWRWSPMGLAGRDPIFYAQLESEMAYIIRDSSLHVPGLLTGSVADNQQAITNTCTSCHGSMGQRQLLIDANKPGSKLNPNFNVDYVYLMDLLSKDEKRPTHQEYAKYGKLAREGISCATCHHIDPPSGKQIADWVASVSKKDPAWVTTETPDTLAYILFHNTTGRFESSEPKVLNGPLKKVFTYPMENALGITPQLNNFISDSKMCGTCHTINLPNIGLSLEKSSTVLNQAETNPAFKPFGHSIEQATFLEWQNSSFGRLDEDFQSCQDCHMPGGFQSLDGAINIDQIVTKIATIQDMTYPETANLGNEEQVDVTVRNNYKRHEHVGLNVFLLEMFNQFPDILGVDKTDYMTSANNGNALAIENMVRQAQKSTIQIDVDVKDKVKGKNNVVDIDVTLTNKTGHRFPSGVAFRRAFLEVLVMKNGKVIWGSGRTNSVGVIVDSLGFPLKTEFLDKGVFQAHHQVITSQDSVQIYEELNRNAQGEFTTSFVHRVENVKDNRLLPKGWFPSTSPYIADQGQVVQQFMKATDPDHTGDDPDYKREGEADFLGQDQILYQVTLPENMDLTDVSVKVTMYSQAIPPYWLHQRFTAAPHKTATQRLYYLASHLNTKGTFIEDWKLPLRSEYYWYDSQINKWKTSLKKIEQ